MPQNIYDQDEFFQGYSQLSRSRHGLDGAAEWPAIQSMLPGLQGLRVVDLGCGFGWFCQWARKQHAAQVLGLDLSEKMLARARATTADPAVTYERTDLESLRLPSASFDLAYSSLAFHYVQDAGRLFRTIHAALVPGGHLVFSTEHPIYMAPSSPGWMTNADGQKTWPVDHYFAEGSRTTDWLANGVVKYHRIIGTTLTLLIQSGFTIDHLREFCPTDQQITANPALAEEIHRPMFLLIAAHRSSL